MNRDFSDTVKLNVIKDNLEKNNGEILCESCKRKLVSIKECHFDYVFPFSKGGQSTEDNCQILCMECNLRKSDKLLKDFALQEKAIAFFYQTNKVDDKSDKVFFSANDSNLKAKDIVSKAEFDSIIGTFIQKHGNIHKADFTREYNHLPSIKYVQDYYGNLESLKKAFGVVDNSLSWSREKILFALQGFITEHNDIRQVDLKSQNNLPSLPCILAKYPEYKNWTEVKKGLLKLKVREGWTYERALEAGKKYLENHSRLTQKSIVGNDLPSTSVIYNLFGDMESYQRALGTEVSVKNEFVSKEAIKDAVNLYFENNERIVESRTVFFEKFKYSLSTIMERYGSFDIFCKEEGISVVKTKKGRYSKEEVDNAIIAWVKLGKAIPTVHELSKVGLPSAGVIMKYYEDWHEPFEIFSHINRTFN